MDSMGTWDLVLLVVVGYLAVHLLVRLTLAHRDRATRQLRRQAAGPESKDRSSKP